MNDEGVIKFTPEHTLAPAISVDTTRLSYWRQVLFDLHVIGVDPARYGGAGFGNVSQRVAPFESEPGKRAFLVSGTQTGGLAVLGPEHWVQVTAYDVEHNRVSSRGPMLPSSEAMTHGVLYDLSTDVRVVLHVHAPKLWCQAERLPCTPAGIAYGTPEMAQAVRRLWDAGALEARNMFAMLGHEDGIIAFGRNADEAGEVLSTAIAQPR